MRSKLSFRIKVLLLAFVVLILIGSLGLIAYFQFSGIVVQVSKATETDESIALTKDILNDLTSAENKVKSYTLTRSGTYIAQFDSISETVRKKINRLYRDQNNTVVRKGEMDSLIFLVDQKFIIMGGLLELQNEFRVQEAFGKIDERLTATRVKNPEYSEPAPAETAPKEEEKKFRLFKRKKKETAKAVAPSENNAEALKANTSALKILKRDLSQVSKGESVKEQTLLQQELEMIQRDAQVTGEIVALLREFENSERKQIAERSEQVKSDVSKTKQLIAFVSIFSSIFLLLLIYVIRNYQRSTNRYLRMIQKAQKEADELAKAKERFLAMISHELRTPMNSIVGFTEQIAQGPLSGTQRSQMDIVRKASNHLLQLINEFLDFTRLQENQLTFQKVPFAANQVVQEVVAMCSSLAAEKGLKLIVDLEENTAGLLQGDAHRLRQILLNLIGNSIKFTQHGNVTVKGRLIDTGTEYTLEIQVIDTGIGIPAEKLSSIFNVFEQASPAISAEYGGSGLGLAITKKLIELQGGQITIASEAGSGTQIVFQIPYDRVQGSEIDAQTEIPRTQNTLTGKTILVVDDEPFNRDLLRVILTKQGAQTFELGDGEKVTEFLTENSVDLVLMDVRMPKLSGVDAALAVRQLTNLQTANTPIMLLTAAITPEDRIKYAEAGIEHVLAKPIHEEELLQAICQLLKLAIPLTGTQQMSESQKTAIHFDILWKSCGNDQKFYLEMLQSLEQSVKGALLQFQDALERKDLPAIASISHKLCGPVKHVNAMALYHLLKEVEKLVNNPGKESLIPAVVEQIRQEGLALCTKIVAETTRQQNLHHS